MYCMCGYVIGFRRSKMKDYACPSSQTVLWRWAKKKYSNWSWEQWSDIPYKITCSTWLVDYYAAMINNVQQSSKQKVVVIEWGCGSGCFAYRLLNVLGSDVLEHYLCFDIQSGMPGMLSGHVGMKKYYDAGRVSFITHSYELVDEWLGPLQERFDPEKYLYVFIFNYMFDALPSDAWYATHDGLQPLALVTEADGSRDWMLREIEHMRMQWVLGNDWVPEALWYKKLKDYMRSLKQVGVVYNVPVVALEATLKLRALLPKALLCITDIPMYRVSSDTIQSTYFVDGMLGSMFDFEIFGHAMRDAGCEVVDALSIPGVELCTTFCTWGVGAPKVSGESLAVYSVMVKKILINQEKWTASDMLAYTEYCHDDAWLLDTLVQKAAGIDIEHEEVKAIWHKKLLRMEKDIYWMPGSKDWLDIATLYRWQKMFDKAYEALHLYAQYQGYDGAYWYCIGFWLYEQNRYYDALDAWQNAVTKNSDYKNVLAKEMQQAEEKLRRA